MKKFNNKSAFTLIEIIVVMIIVGVLAAIALPNLFNNVTRSQAAEAVAALGADKSMVEGCIMGHETTADACASIAFVSTANFTYTFGTLPIPAGGGPYTIVASNIGTVTDTVTLTKNVASGALVCSGASEYQGVC